MADVTVDNSAVNPCYCPNCQRIFHHVPADYLCPVDRAPLIDAGEDLPTKMPMLLQMGLGVVSAAVLCTGLLV
jgi:hypothetical protein